MTPYLILTLLAAIVVGISTYYLASISVRAKKVLTGVYFAILMAMAYLLYNSIAQPIQFENEKQVRYKATIERLNNIRKAQMAYKSAYGKYSPQFDSLIAFVKTDSLKLIKKIGMVPDSLTLKYNMQEAEKIALKMGIISRDTMFVSVLDSLFPPAFAIDSIRYVPFQGSETFEMETEEIETISKVFVPVFEAKVHNDIILKGLNRQLIVNLNDELLHKDLYPGLKIGSLTEVTNNNGNWE